MIEERFIYERLRSGNGNDWSINRLMNDRLLGRTVEIHYDTDEAIVRLRTKALNAESEQPK